MTPNNDNPVGKSIRGEITGITRWFLHNLIFKMLYNKNYTLIYNMVLGYGIRLLVTLFVRNFYHNFPISNSVYYVIMGITGTIVLYEIQQRIINLYKEVKRLNKKKKLNK